MKKDLYQTVTDHILAQLEQGVTPWIKPWSTTPTAGRNMPYNASTGVDYQGTNIVVLWMAMQCNPQWLVPAFLTFKQAKQLGGTVRGGEKSQVSIIKVGQFLIEDKKKKKPDGSAEERRMSYLKEHAVFNIAQCDGMPERVTRPLMMVPVSKSKHQRIAIIDEFVAATGIAVKHGGAKAMYIPSHDYVQLPFLEEFNSAKQYYNTTFHELGHGTGHKSRLARDMSGRFGDKAYAAEELVAELCAAFLCAEFSIDGDLQHANYLDHWIKLMKSDNRAFFTAASKASQAVAYLRKQALQDTHEKEAA